MVSLEKATVGGTKRVVFDKPPLSVRQRKRLSNTQTAVVPIRFEAKVPAASGSAGTDKYRPFSRKPKDIPNKRAATAFRFVVTDKSSPSCRKRKKADIDPCCDCGT
jgi:hypothetical protein